VTSVVLMYHRVAALDDDPYGLAVHPTRFAEQMEHLQSLGRVVPLADVPTGGRATSIAITFDDGYVDNVTTAAPVLEAAGLPATYFITTGTLGGQTFWWDRLAVPFRGEHPMPDGITVCLGGRELWLATQDTAARETSLRFLHRRLRPLPPDELQEVVDDLLKRLAAPPPPPDSDTMTVAQLRQLGAQSHAQIGAHTRTHLQLAGQDPALQRDEVIGSVEQLRELLGRPVSTFAFPFGTRRAVGDLAPRLAREAGCTIACSTEPGAVQRRSDRHRLPRLNVRSWTAEELDQRIRRLAPLH
jgi:peptidoglycan/xylan/chitin deacetylase (PgdA/CDA1 family)